MTLALGTAALVLLALLWELYRPRVVRELVRVRARILARRGALARSGYDPGRERRAERRARALLRSCVSESDWEMYRDLGFLRVTGGIGGRVGEEGTSPAGGDACQGPSYAYLIYPHKPIVAYIPHTRELLNEYCVTFPDHSRPYGSSRLPDSDDVLAKWMAITGDERRLIAEANMHLPGRQVDPERAQRDLARLAHWEHERAARRSGDRAARGGGEATPVSAAVGQARARAGRVRPA